MKEVNIMKKILCFALILSIIFSLQACGFDTPTKESNTAGTSSSSKAEKETYGLNETAVFNNLKFTATEIKESTGGSFLAPDDGNVYVGVKFTVENISDEEQAVSSVLLFDAYSGDAKCDYSISALTEFDGSSIDGSIAPGKKLEGWYGVEVPADWSEIELDVKSDLLSSGTARFVFRK